MRRFSQRNSLVTLSEINITPLLDLAFVLLVIFIITRPLLEGKLNLQLPEVGKADARNIDKRDVRVVEINARGQYFLAGKILSLQRLEAALVQSYQDDPKLVVDIRADKRVPWDSVMNVMAACMRNHITRITPRFKATDSQ